MSKTQTKEKDALLLDLKPVAGEMKVGDTITYPDGSKGKIVFAPKSAAKPKASGKKAGTNVALREADPKSTAVATTPEEDLDAFIMRASTDPKFDTAKLKEMLDMRRALHRERQEREFFVAFHAAKAEMPIVVKDGRNPATKSSYPKLETISKVVDPIAHKHGFSASYGTADSPLPGHYRIVCDLLHVGGHSRRYFADIPADNTGQKGEKNKSDTHGAGSSMSYGRRYIKVLMYDLVIAGEDTDAVRRQDDQPQKVTADQAKKLRDMVLAVGCSEDSFVDFMGDRHAAKFWPIERIEDIPAKLFDEGMRQLQAFERNRKAAK